MLSSGAKTSQVSQFSLWQTCNPEPPTLLLLLAKAIWVFKMQSSIRAIACNRAMCNHLLAASKDLPGVRSMLRFCLTTHRGKLNMNVEK